MNTLNRYFTMTTVSMLTLFMLITVASAQVPGYNIGEALKEAAPPPKETPVGKKPPAAPVIIQEEEKPFSMPEGEKIFIKDFKLEGALPADEAALIALLAFYKGRDLTMTEITEAANKLTAFYRDKGYLIAKAYVPKQDATDGILTIKIIIGKYGTFSLKNASPVRDFLLQGVFDRVNKTSPVVTRDSLERAMLLVRDMPGVKLPIVTIAPGAAPGTSDFAVDIDKSQRFNGYIMGDNQGSRYTGKNRVYGGIDINSLLGLADKFSASGMITNENNGLENVRLAYSFPLGYTGLRTEFGVSRTTYTLGGVYSDLDAKGKADIAEGTISYPIKKTRDESIDLSLNIAYKKLKDEQAAVDTENPRDAAVATLSLQKGAFGSLFGRPLFTNMTASVGLGTVKIQDDAAKALNDAGANTSGAFSKLNLGFSGNMELTEKFSFRASARIQKVLTAHNLDPVEQMFISGSSGVRAYTETVSYDNGYLVNAELRYSLPSLFGVKHALGAFIDNGWVYAQNGDYATETRAMITDVGLGYYVSVWQFFGSIMLAEPIGGTWNRNVSDPGTRVLAQVGMTF